MPNTTVFFSWQVDTEPRGGRNLIDRALERAAARISRDTTVEEAVRQLTIDRDTKGVAGSPPIVDTIFRKIDQAAVFVPDLTFIGKRPDGRPTPNPNVLIEYGWAPKSIGHGRIVPVMNTAYGEPTTDAMPFDMRHLRNPLTYDCPNDLDDSARRQVREKLAEELERALRVVLDSDEFKGGLPKPPAPVPFVAKEQAPFGHGRFRVPAEPLGLMGGGVYGGPRELRLSPHPVTWFRMMPSTDPGQTWTVEDIERGVKTPTVLHPLNRGWGGYGFVRSHDGYGVYAPLGDERETTRSVVFAFTTGEVWSVDSYWLETCKYDGRSTIPDVEHSFREALHDYGRFLEGLGVTPPFRWVAGMENLKGRDLHVPTRSGMMRGFPSPQGKCLVDAVTESGVYSPGDPPGKVLKPFFTKLYNSCAVSRQDWQDN